MECPSCNTNQAAPNTVYMAWEDRSDISDGHRWRCPNCRKTSTIRKDSFFEKSRLTLQKWLLLMFFWARQDPVSQAKIDAEVSMDAAIDVYGWLRDICSRKLLNTNIQLGGPNKIVQIDESLFRHKPKHHRGRATSREVWVFGMVDTSTQPALGYMEIVPDRRAQTLLPIIQSHVNPGSTVYSDQWSAYSNVSSLRNVASHSTVNHSLHFVEPTTGVHTQHVESYWSQVKRKFKRMKGCHAPQLPSYLDEYMWRERFGKTASDAFENIIVHIAEYYPV